MPSALSIFMMILQIVAGVMIPVGLFLYIKHRHDGRPKAFFLGAGVFILFALVLEAMVHQVVLNSPTGQAMSSNIFLYALYGGFMAALFEETGRYLAMKFGMKGMYDNDANAAMYGAGHGGAECLILLGMTGINNLTLALAIKGGTILPANLPVEAQAAADALINTNAFIFLLGIVERIFAVTLHIGLSLLVWKTVTSRQKKPVYLLLAYLLHFAMDFFSVLAVSFAGSVLAEVFIGVFAIGTFFFALSLYKKRVNA